MSTYLNNAGAALVSDEVHGRIVEHLRRERQIGAYAAAQECRDEVEQFYQNAARSINAASPTEIAFVDSASRAWNTVLSAVTLNPGDKVVTLSSEFGTNLVSLAHLTQRVGASLTVVPCAQDGSFSMNDFESASSGASLIAISHATAQAAILNPVVEVGKLARSTGAVYLVDGCQALGQTPVDVEQIDCDAYTATGRKWLRGPRGTGFLYVRAGSALQARDVDLANADLILNPTSGAITGIEVRRDARQFELWERSVAGLLGLNTALLEFLSSDPEPKYEVLSLYGGMLRAAVAKNSKLQLLGQDPCSLGTVGFYCLEPSEEVEVSTQLQRGGVSLSSMHDWDCPLFFPTNGATQIFRLSPHYYSAHDEIEKVATLIERL